MEKCRICLRVRKRMHCLDDSMEEGLCITYADMVASISNVKVSKIDGIPDDICLACCKRLKYTYDFRCLIERSDIELQKTCRFKRIIFTDIEDIKCKINITESDSKDAKLQHSNITDQFVQSCEQSLNYNSTIIKRLPSPDRNDKKTLCVKEFLESIKEDNVYDICYDVAVDFEAESDEKDDDGMEHEPELDEKDDDGMEHEPESDEKYDDGMEHEPESDEKDDDGMDYEPESDVGDDEDYTPIKKYNYNKQKRKLNNGDDKENKLSIKPVFLSDIRVARTKLPVKKRKILRSTPRRDMCPHCGKMFKDLKTHALTHIGKRNFKCEKCCKSFYTQNVLKTHEQTHGKRDFKCDKCVASFRNAGCLKTHLKRHTEKKQFPCEICGKAFRTKNHLWRHCHGIHNMGTKDFACEQCSMCFATRSTLNHHMRVHTGERPYKCEICSQPYSYKRDFNRHCLKKHGVFLKGRSVFVMNEEALVQERVLMSDLMLRVNGVVKDGNLINPFEGPHAVKAFEQAVKALEARQITIDPQ